MTFFSIRENFCFFTSCTGYTSAISYGTATIISLFGRPIIKAIKPMNLLVLAIWVECAREVTYSYVE